MKWTASLAGMAAGVLLASLPVLAHHSFAAEFDANKPVTLRGTLSKMEWINPHGWLHMDVKGPDGKVEIVGDRSGRAQRVDPPRPAQDGLPDRQRDHGRRLSRERRDVKANGVTVKFTDGRNFFLGSSGTGTPGAPSER